MDERMICDHDLAEQETACAMDRLCPICLLQRVKELEEAIKKVEKPPVQHPGIWQRITMDRAEAIEELYKVLKEGKWMIG